MEQSEVHHCLIGILQAVISLCQEHAIETVLIGGGCLGIVRHGNRMVPWDDDLDLAIWQVDIPRFLAAARSLPPRFTLAPCASASALILKVFDQHTTALDPDGIPLPGVFVDVIAMGCWPSRFWKQLDNHITSLALLKRYPGSSNPWKRAGKQLAQLLHYPSWGPWLYRRILVNPLKCWGQRCRRQRTGVISGATGGYWRGIYPWDVVYPLRMRQLEGLSVPTPNQLHRFLVLRYGSHYLDIPPEDTRWRHISSASWREC